MDSSKIYKIILFFGQSNALGQSTLTSSLSGAYANHGDEHARVRMATILQCNNDAGAAACATEHATHRVQARTNSQGTFGPEVGICRTIPNIETHAADGNIIILKAATGATDMTNDWAPGSTTTLCYQRMIDYLNNSDQIWAASFEVIGAIMIQGEADAQVQAEADAYEANLNTMLAQLRTDTSQASLPFVDAQLHTDNASTYAATVRTAKTNVAAASANNHLVSVDAVPTEVDNVHFTENGCAQAGEILGAYLDGLFTACV